MTIRSNNNRQRYDKRRFHKKQKKYEEDGIVLDVIPADLNRRKDKYKDSAVIQVLGKSWFTLLEIIPTDDNTLMLHDNIALSKGDRNQIQTIIGRLKYDDLTPIAELQLPIAVDKILDEKSMRFISFINKASPISLRLHSLHLLKGIGPKSLNIILNERKIMPYTSYEDFEERTKIKDIKSLIKKRIIEEITSEDCKHRLFTRSFPAERY